MRYMRRPTKRSGVVPDAHDRIESGKHLDKKLELLNAACAGSCQTNDICPEATLKPAIRCMVPKPIELVLCEVAAILAT